MCTTAGKNIALSSHLYTDEPSRCNFLLYMRTIVLVFMLVQRLLRRRAVPALAVVLFISLLTLYESFRHSHVHDLARPTVQLDPAFTTNQYRAQTVNTTSSSRKNAAVLMLARNSDRSDAVAAIRSLERRFNHRFHYPIIFLNNEAWDERFTRALSAEVSGDVVFDTIPADMWGYRSGITKEELEKAQKGMVSMASKGVPHAESEDYHHMCRFYSGFFFDHPTLLQYNWFWRLDPDSRILCDIPYDPFAEMIARDQIYGYTMALWEVGSSAPSLFRTMSEYRAIAGISTTSLWTAMLEASWAPLPVRYGIMPWFPSRDGTGDAWNLCHFWSNFEIADLRFFRSAEYRDLFNYLDSTGGFHLERWGDAVVHSLALALLSQPEKLHYFEDFGYKHGGLQHCPSEASLPDGCTCDCRAGEKAPPAVCLNRLREAVEPLSQVS